MNEIQSSGIPANLFPGPVFRQPGEEFPRIGIVLTRAEIERYEWLDK